MEFAQSFKTIWETTSKAGKALIVVVGVVTAALIVVAAITGPKY
jgi:hypothetical protein